MNGDSATTPLSSLFTNRRLSSKSSINSGISTKSAQLDKENFLVYQQIDQVPDETSIIRWRHYGRLCGKPFLLASVICLFLSTQLLMTGVDYWIAYWFVVLSCIFQGSFCNDFRYIIFYRTTVEQIRKGMGHENHSHYHPTNHTVIGLNQIYSFYGVMSTEMCIYVNFALVITLLAVAGVR